MDSNTQSSNWTVTQVTITAICCFFLGGAIGFVAHGPTAARATVPTPVAASSQPAAPQAMAPPISTDTPSAAQLQAASKQAAVPLVEQLKKNPKDFKLLVQAGEMYYHHGAFADAASYYKRALEVKDNVLVRNQYASSLYYQGDADGALQQYSATMLRMRSLSSIAAWSTTN